MKIEKFQKLVANLHDKIEYFIRIRSLKQALNHGLALKNVHRVIKFNQKALLKPYIEMNTDLRKAAKNDFEKDIRKHSDIKLVTTEKRRNYLVSEPNYHTTKFFTEYLLTIEVKKTYIFMNKPVYLGLSILELSKTVMYEFWYDHVKQKYGEKAKLCCMDTVSFIVYIKTDYIYKGIAVDVETRFNTSNYVLERPLGKGKNKQVIGLMKDEIGRKILTVFIGLRAKTYTYLIHDVSEDKKEKGTKK